MSATATAAAATAAKKNRAVLGSPAPAPVTTAAHSRNRSSTRRHQLAPAPAAGHYLSHDTDAAAAAGASSAACEAAPLPPPGASVAGLIAAANGAVQEIYYDDATSYLGYVAGTRSSAATSEAGSDVDDADLKQRHRRHSDFDADDDNDNDDRVFDERVRSALQAGASPARAGFASQPAAAEDDVTSFMATAGAAAIPPPLRVRHNVYSLRVMPDWAYAYTAPPPVTFSNDEPDAMVAGNGDDVDTAPMTSAVGHHHAMPVGHHLMPDAAAAAAATPSFDHHHHRPAASAAAAAAVMCCYFKQGHCSMGDSCWYAHYGDAATPCHYGASCRKGHRQLVRSNAAAPAVPKEGPPSAAAPTAAAAGPSSSAASAAGGGAVPKRYVHEPKPVKPSAPVMECPDMECPHCGEAGAIRTQDFPLFEGNRARTATRAHCGKCMRTFMVA